MPGISLFRGELDDQREAVDAAFESVRFLDSYDRDVAVETDRTVLGHTGYDDYPLRRFETDRAVAVLEGYLYDVTDTEAAVRTAVELLARGDDAALREWLGSRDGDFLLAVAWREDGTLTLLNDTFGRLPTYYGTVAGTAVVSRELSLLRTFARELERPLEMDRLTAAHQLVFGYSLGDRTTFREVRCVPPGSRVDVDEEVDVRRLYRHDFEGKAHSDRSVEANAAALASRFADACRRRASLPGETVLSLSGGLDSRAIAAAFDDMDVPFRAVTFDTAHDAYAADVRVARSITEALDVEWSLYQSRPSEAHDELLLETLQGMNYLAMSFILDFFEQLRREVGAATYVTGDGGDKILVDLSAPREYGSESALVEYVLDANSKLPLERAAAITGVDASTIRSSVAQRLRTYPEDSRTQRYAHFLFRERGLNFLNHGEDRNRYYFWSATPFYSLPVFRYAMNCPDAQKRQRRLYTAVLEQFSPDLLDIEYPNFGAPITSLEYRLKKRSYDLASRYPSVRDAVVRWLKVRDDVNEEIVATIEGTLSESTVRPLSRPAIRDALAHGDQFRSQALYALYTVTAFAAARNHERDQRASPLSGR